MPEDKDSPDIPAGHQFFEEGAPLGAPSPDTAPIDPVESSGWDAVGKWIPPTLEEMARLFPEFEILALLGSGAMGAVYHAVQNNLDRNVALKLLPPELAKSAEFEERFRREAQSLAQLNHPNIVQIYHFGQTPGEEFFYFLMEFVEGVDLAQYIHNPGLDVNGALNAVAQICEALQYAHSKGFVHRDIKPANIFLNTEGTLKIGDFGLAKSVSEEGEPSIPDQIGLTMTGMAVGSPHYVAPEQLTEGIEIDQRADLYSLGVMFYEMLTGLIPQGAVLNPSQKLPNLDVRIDGVVFKAMEPDRDSRYASAADIRTDIAVIQTSNDPLPSQQKEIEKPPPERKRKSVVPLVLSIIAVTALLAVGGLFAVKHFFASGQSIGGNKQPKGPRPEFPVKGNLDSGEYDFYNKTRGGRDLPVCQHFDVASIDCPFENSLGMRLVPVPVIGGKTGGKRLLFSIWETRRKDFEVFAKEAGRSVDKPEAPVSAEAPAAGVSWEDADAFCRWLTNRERESGHITNSQSYDLPGDHEWSCMLGIGALEAPENSIDQKKTRFKPLYPWGRGTIPSGAGNWFGTENSPGKDGESKVYPVRSNTVQGTVIAGYNDGFETVSPCGLFLSSSNFGIWDAGGNVREWCRDSFNADGSEKVTRGGGFLDGLLPVASTNRRGAGRFSTEPDLGFRVVLRSTTTERFDLQTLAPIKVDNVFVPPPPEPVSDKQYHIDNDKVVKTLRLDFKSQKRDLIDAHLILQTIPGKHSETNGHINVYLDKRELGTKKGAGVKQRILIPLDVARIPTDDSTFTLEVKCETANGVIFEGRGDFEPRLRLTYHPEESKPHIGEVGGARLEFYNSNRGGRDLTATNDPEKSNPNHPFENDLGMRFVPVTVTGGPSSGERLLVSIWETRVRDYAAFIEESKGRIRKPDFPQGSEHPAVNVLYEEAAAFCQWLTNRDIKKRLIGGNLIYRLPTDHEWSCFSGIGEVEDGFLSPYLKSGHISRSDEQPNSLYAWGNRFPPPRGAGNFSGRERPSSLPYIPEIEDGFRFTSPAGLFQPNIHGIYDIAGNVEEFCDSKFYGAHDKEDRGLTKRGGSFKSFRSNVLRTSYRARYINEKALGESGFRIVLGKPIPSSQFRPHAVPKPPVGTRETLEGESVTFYNNTKGGRTLPAVSDLSSATRVRPFENGIGMRFIPVDARGKKLYFSIWETRIKDFAAFVKATNRKWQRPENSTGEYPANFNYDDALAFCEWLNQSAKPGPNLVYRFTD